MMDMWLWLCWRLRWSTRRKRRMMNCDLGGVKVEVEFQEEVKG